MDTRSTIRIAVPQYKNLSRVQRAFVEALHARLIAEGLRPAFDGLDTHHLEQRYDQLRNSQGVIVVAFAQWRAERLHRDEDRSVIFPTEFCHVATAMAVAAKRPLLVLRSKDVALRGSLKEGYVHPVVTVPKTAGPEWLGTSAFEDSFVEWLTRVHAHRHVFLGYSSKARPMAEVVTSLLTGVLGLSILDWHDSPVSDTIIQNIADAERLTMCGIFLFTKDDRQIRGQARTAVPRDNVVYEAGYFAGAKGRQSVLIIREGDAQMPTDLGGFVYVPMRNRSDVAPIQAKVSEYFAARLPKT